MRIAGTNIPDKKHLNVGLTEIFGIGRYKSEKVLKEVNVAFTKLPKDLTPEEENKIRELIEKNRIEGDLRREISTNIKRLREIKAYRGVRHSRRLPSRGQRTKTNSRTIRGNVRATMASGKRKVDKK